MNVANCTVLILPNVLKQEYNLTQKVQIGEMWN